MIWARSQPERLKRIIDSSLVPIIMVDSERRYVEVNTPARLAFRLSLAELRRLRLDDHTPPHSLPTLEAAWPRLLETGCVAGSYVVASPDDSSRLDVTYYALADVLPGLHLIAFAPADWSDAELVTDGQLDSGAFPALTPRELEVLELAADGRNAPKIAEELVVSVATVRTHFGNIYDKLDVGDRASAVAKAMRLGLIA
jgi:DNA-binding CsgD family transcriptional regulator